MQRPLLGRGERSKGWFPGSCSGGPDFLPLHWVMPIPVSGSLMGRTPANGRTRDGTSVPQVAVPWPPEHPAQEVPPCSCFWHKRGTPCTRWGRGTPGPVAAWLGHPIYPRPGPVEQPQAAQGPQQPHRHLGWVSSERTSRSTWSSPLREGRMLLLNPPCPGLIQPPPKLSCAGDSIPRGSRCLCLPTQTATRFSWCPLQPLLCLLLPKEGGQVSSSSSPSPSMAAFQAFADCYHAPF